MAKLADCITKLTVAGEKILAPETKVVKTQLRSFSVPNEVRIENLKPEHIKANFLPVNSSKNSVPFTKIQKAKTATINSPENVSIRSLGDAIIKSGDEGLIYRITRHPQTPEEQMLKAYLETEYGLQVSKIRFEIPYYKFEEKWPNLNMSK